MAEHSDEAVLARFNDAALPAGPREAAFTELVHRYQRRVFAVCLQVLGAPSDAEDAAQETFVRLARGAAGFRGDAKLSTWLYRVARNVCTDHVRYDARRPSTPVDDVAAVGGDRAAEDVLTARETASTLQTALAELDATSRRLLLLVAVEGLTYAEAAAAADLPVGTVKSRVSRARVRLGELLREEPDPRSPAARAADDAPADRRPPASDLQTRGPPA
ncbi:sigma-24 (FecI-like protein) [Egicoccus halophilus]|uniref:Sigma-24 (FecI-like protein) n=1 Tax=Egicoccus halophilus TaxID=1670830 RepID=A0A8J3EQS0_9ACTN|nr:sigma-24 (FecI-like protein) [Egicoccus halophilus]